jgi:ABC-2 type transport system permease protein
MTTVVSPRTPALIRPEHSEEGFRNAYATELQKLLAHLTTRLLGLVALLGPFAFTAILKVQSGTPSDALFGAWVHSSGFAVSLVTLGFAGSWGFPIIAGVLAGDLFSAEDRYGTWKTILTRSASREDVFAGKLLAVGTLVIGLSIVLGVASMVTGVALVGAHPLVDLSGQVTSAGRMFALSVVAWIYCLLPVLAYTAVAVLFSVATRNGILGVLSPLIVALATQLLDLIGKGVIVHTLLIGSGFDGWHGLFVTHPFFGPLAVSALVCLAWIAACLGGSWWILRSRDFLTGAATRGPDWSTPIRVVLVATATIAVLALASDLGPDGVTGYRVAASVGPAIDHATLLQQALIGRPAPPTAQLRVEPNCNKRGAVDSGPGDWLCNVYVYLPQPKAVEFQQTNVEYDVSVQYNGCWKASSPPAFIGGQTLQNAAGRSVTNPLFVVYGCFNIF